MFYATPPGFIDQPYFWALDTDAVTNGTNATLNINFPGGFSFHARRFTGVHTVVNPNSLTSGFNFLFEGRQAYASATLRNPAKLRDRLIIPEANYMPTAGLQFTLENTLCASIADGLQTIPYGQICFQGARRREGSIAVDPSRKFRRIPFHKQCVIDLNYSYFGTQRERQFSFNVDDFDFEAHCIYWTFDSFGSYSWNFEGIGGAVSVTATAVVPRIITIDVQAPALNPTLNISVVGDTITIELQTSGGNTTVAQLIAGIEANAAASALISLSSTGNDASQFLEVGDVQTSGGLQDATYAQTFPTFGPVAKFCLYDYAGNGLMPTPILIDYLNEPIPFGDVANQKSGALYPILLYPKDSAIRVDMVSLLRTNAALSVKMNIIGMQRIPC